MVLFTSGYSIYARTILRLHSDVCSLCLLVLLSCVPAALCVWCSLLLFQAIALFFLLIEVCIQHSKQFNARRHNGVTNRIDYFFNVKTQMRTFSQDISDTRTEMSARIIKLNAWSISLSLPTDTYYSTTFIFISQRQNSLKQIAFNFRVLFCFSKIDGNLSRILVVVACARKYHQIENQSFYYYIIDFKSTSVCAPGFYFRFYFSRYPYSIGK